MKRFFLLLSCFSALLAGAELSAVHSVYLMPMANGLDQYLANRITNEHVFQVVTNPKLADAIFTDRIGEVLEEKLADLIPSPELVARPAPTQPSSALPGEAANKLSNPATASNFGRGKGNIFLVDPKSHQVVWSAYRTPKSSASSDMDRTASDMVSRLKRALKPQ
jgi:hypothetical protein